MRQTDASDVSKSIPVINRPAAPLQHELSADRRCEEFRDSGSRNRPSSELWIRQAKAPDYSECDRCAYQHCSWPTARVK
eukprot:238807-Pyramimonas_sp.AAC.1